MSLGNNIKRIREIKKISIDEMVKRLSTFKQTYINIEKGLLKPKKDILIKISSIFDMSENDIINFREEILINSIRQLDIKNLKDIVSSVEVKVKPKEIQTILTPITKTPINVVLEDLSVKEVVYRKPILLTPSELFQIGNKIKTVEVKESLPNETFIDRFGDLDPSLIVSKDRSFSSKLLNLIKPFIINGAEKTLFYTEINTGLKVGDKVFIVNGNYDSNSFIEENKYKRKVDGYTVLFIDKCEVVLDMDYEEGKLPFINDEVDNFINVYYIESESDFLQANRQITSRGGNFNYKFSRNQNNIAFFNSEFNPISNISSPTWGESSGITQRGFYVKDNNTWVNISSSITSGSFSIALSEEYTNNGKIKIHNGSFTFSVGSKVVSFNDGFVYDWKVSSWVIDNRYNTPFITKSNFRKGDFNGVFNSGVFGTQEERIRWDKDTFEKATWNTGVLLNTTWLSGEMKSINTLNESYVAEFDEDNIPYQKLNAPNNNGNGFNYIENSEFIKVSVENGIFNSSNIGQDVAYSIMKEYITGSTDSSIYNFNIDKAILNRCNVVGGLIKDSDIVNSRFLNAKLENIKSVNSNYKLSVIKDSVYISDSIIKILGYDEFSIAEKGNDRHSHKVYKFYITKDSYNSLKIRDIFYISGLSILDNSKYPLNFFDRRFKISSWTEYFDSYKDNQFIKRGFEVGAFLSTPGDNNSKFNYAIETSSRFKTVITGDNDNSKYHSLDIVVSTYDINEHIIESDGVTNELPINGLSINTKLDASYIGKQDSEFVVNQGFDGRTNVVVVVDGKVLIGGNFNNYKGQFSPFIIRLNSDGSIDQTFNVGEGFDGEVLDIKIDLDGKIVVGGKFNSYQGIDSISLIRLNNDGSIDNTFKLKHGSDNQKVNTIQVDGNNRLLVGGLFDTYESPTGDEESNLKNILRLLQDDSFDDNFNDIIDVYIGNYIDDEEVKVIKESGKIHIGGEFKNDIGLITIEEDGGNPQDYNSILTEDITSVNTIEIQDDFIFIGGIIDGVDKLAKIDIGNIDYVNEKDDFDGTINHIKINSDKIYALGGFTDGIKVYDLSLVEDVDFNPPIRFNGETTNCDFYDNRLYATGEFTSYNNQRYINIVRIKLFYSDLISLGDNIDITNAYIVNSDFESGIIENTDWVSGNHINYSNDVNIVDNNFGTYSITAITSSSELVINTGYTSSYKEAGDDSLQVGNIVFLGNVEYLSPNGQIINLGDAYKIVESFENNNQLRLEEIGTNTIESITQSGGTFSTQGAQNRYSYIYKAKLNKSKISSGIFRRSYLTGCFIENENIDISDKDFNNISNLKGLIISDSIFKNNGNIFSKALYMNSSFIGGDDKFENGIVYNSIWNGLEFQRGVFKESRWVNGEFNSGLFYNNRSFDGITSSITPMYNDERVKSYYKDGITSNTQSNNRYSWQDGGFNGGDFFESDWENGEFNSGKFYYSKFYNGNINGGVVGDRNIPLTNTLVYNGIINFTTVENASIFATDNSSGITSSIIWKDGIFNEGEFGSNENHVAIWENGEFNSGNFENMAIWKNGRFNNGKFLSSYGWTMSDSTNIEDYTWQNGEFNGGEFGNANVTYNSTWFNGEFNGGKFIGRVWNNGIFTNGDFIGSATYSAVRGVTATQSNALLFTESFTSSYYGLWRDGIVSNKKDEFIKDRQILIPVVRSKERFKQINTTISNSLWLNGTFSHSSGSMQNSVWLNGVFERGTFFNSSFNPYVKRNGSTQLSFELSDSCKWVNGELLDSDFYISKWEKGKFDTGDAYGMIWKDGVCNYMNAFNIFWEGGLWRNGNWYGSYMNYNGMLEDDFNKQILLRGVSWSGTQSMHLWNIFSDSSPATDFSSASASAISTITLGELPSTIGD